MIFDEAIGWMGAFFLLLAFVLVSFTIIDTEGWLFPLFNLAGSLGIVYISLRKKAYPPAVLNIIWGLVALVSLIGLLF